MSELVGSGPSSRGASRLRQVVVSVFLVVFCFVQSPRLITADTKLDLAVDPWGFLGRALHLWDSQGAAGQLQNQAYGYLFPMGPFFGVGQSLGLPPWAVQRLWWSLILLVAYHGVRVLALRMGLGDTTTRTIAALAYALSPRITGGLGAISIELWPMAVAPWVLLPLVRVQAGRERAAAGRSALALLCVGGVNAVATGAVLVLPFLFLLLRGRDLVYRRVFAWWGVLTVGAMLWWLVPLMLLGRYSPPFLSWIESASVTTTLGSLPEAFRGTTHWLAGIVTSAGTQWPAAHEVLVGRAGVLAGLELALIGAWGLSRTDVRHGRFLRVGLITGLTLLTLGHTGPLAAPWAEQVQHLLDGPLAPVRNLHKFDLVVRLPLALGVAHLLAVVRPRLRETPWASRLLPGVAVLALVSLVAPAVTIGVSQARPFTEIPSWWGDAARYLGQQPRDRTLLLPGSNFFVGLWGSPRDEPLQPLASSPWMVRDAVPLGSAGATRELTAIEQAVSTGHGGQRLASLLASLGVDRVLVRADLDWRATGAPPPLVVRQALAETPGVSPGRTFGPIIGGSFRSDVAVDDGIDQGVPTLQVFEVANGRTTAPTLVAAAGVGILAGGPEGVAQAEPGATWVLASDRESLRTIKAAGGGQTGAVTDTQQRREASFASVRDSYGPLLRADEAYSAPRPTHDYLTPGMRAPQDQSTSIRDGGVRVEASTSGATPLFGQKLQLARGPGAGFDGSDDTSWVSAAPATGSWLRVTWPEDKEIPSVVPVQLDSGTGADVAAVELRTEQGVVRTPVDAPTAVAPDRQRVMAEAHPGPSRFVEIRVVAVRGDRGRPAAVAELGPGVLPEAPQSLRTPALNAVEASSFALSVRGDRLNPCVLDAAGIARCQVARQRNGEEDLGMRRTVTPPKGTWTLEGTVAARPGAALDALLDGSHPAKVVSTSRWLADPLVRPGNLVDGDPATYWASDPADPAPAVTLRLPKPRRVSSLVVDTESSVVGARPQQVRITSGGRSLVRDVDVDGSVSFPAITTSRMTVTVLKATTSTSVRTGGARSSMPVVIGELRINGVAWPSQRDSQGGRACGFGPEVQVDGKPVATELVAPVADISSGRAVALRPCEDLTFDGGVHTVSLVASAEFIPQTLNLTMEGVPRTRSGAAVPLEWTSVSDTERTLVVPRRDSSSVLSVPENQNDGWVATLDGKDLTALRLDGWRQAWVVPAGSGGIVHLSYAPQTPFTAGLVLGALAALLVLLTALWPSRARLVEPRRGPQSELPATALGAVGVVVVGGPWGVLALLLAVVLRRVLKVGEIAFVVLGTVMVAVAAWSPWPRPAATNHGGAAQMLVLVLLAMLVSSGWRRPPAPALADPRPPGVGQVPAGSSDEPS